VPLLGLSLHKALRARLHYLILIVAATPLAAQQRAQSSSENWNTPRVLELVERARGRRAAPRSDTALRNYQAHADGYVYFYLDRKNGEDRTLVRVDQVALNLYWASPNLTKQHIIGMRDESRLPNKMYYHLDHLTVVQDDFGDLIRLGDGDEVRTVPHPAAPGTDSVYDFRLADSLTLRLNAGTNTVRVYEIKVRPKHNDRPAFIGSLFVDQNSAAIVRMTFTFTPASYVDKRLDYINVSLDNALWREHFWLPNEQRVEIRRQIPELDFPAGAVIRGVMKIGQYQFNQQLPPDLFAGARVVASPKEAREKYPFERGIYEGLATEGLAPPPEMATLRAMAMQLAKQKYLSGLPRVRLHIPNASSALRFNRAEGLFFGAGLSYTPSSSTTLETSGGFASGPGHGLLDTNLRWAASDASHLRLGAFYNDLRDIGPLPGAPGALNTLSSAFAGRDFLDPYFASGVTLGVEHQLNSTWRFGVDLSAEHAKSASLEYRDALVGSARFRPIRPITNGDILGATLSLRREGSANARSTWNGGVAVELGKFNFTVLSNAIYPPNRSFARGLFDAGIKSASLDQRTVLRLNLNAGIGSTYVPWQRFFLLGGQGTLPGYGYRVFAGSRFGLAQALVTRDVKPPWVRLRAFGGAGWTGSSGRIGIVNSTLPFGWNASTTDGVKTSVGIGAGLLWDIIRLDVARGLSSGGRTRLYLSVTPDLADIL
jgi:hypothetical protein